MPEILTLDATDCGHDHADSPEGALACATARALVKRTEGRALCVMIEDDDGPRLTLSANMAGVASMATALCEFAFSKGRPNDCATCVEAYDRLAECLALLRTVPTKC